MKHQNPYTHGGAITGVIVAIASLIGALGVGVYREAQEWEAFKVEHQCRVVAHISGDVFNIMGIKPDGSVSVSIGSTPSKKGWLCDDGVTYYR